MKRKRHNFNFIELMIAMVILGFGLTSVMVLLPLGITAYKDAIGDNNMASAAELVAGYLKVYGLNANLPASEPAEKNDAMENLAIDNCWDPIAASDDAFKYLTIYTGAGETQVQGLFRYEIANEPTPGEKIVDFRALIIVTRDTGDNLARVVVEPEGQEGGAALPSYLVCIPDTGIVPQDNAI